MRMILTTLSILFLICCGTQKKYSDKETIIENTVVGDYLTRLSSYIHTQWDNTHNFKHDEISLPLDYNNRNWKNEIGESWKGSEIDTIFIKYLIYCGKLDSLLSNEIPKIHFSTFDKYYTKPSVISDNKKDNSKIYHYFFNTLVNPNCSCRESRNDYFGTNCSIIDFEFDSFGHLHRVNTIMFSP